MKKTLAQQGRVAYYHYALYTHEVIYIYIYIYTSSFVRIATAAAAVALCLFCVEA